MSTPILHCGWKVTKEELKDVETPVGTATWKPVPHYEVAQLVTAEAVSRGYEISSEEYGISGKRMFAVLRLHPHGNPEYTRALGFRNSHDKSLSLGLTAGLQIVVCENLVFKGEKTIHRKHTSGIEIETLIPKAFGNLCEEFEVLEKRVTVLKSISITMDKARLLVVKAAEMKFIPSCDIMKVLRIYREPPHAEFKPKTMWSLYNSFTERVKVYSPAKADETYRGLAKIFELN